MSKDVVMTLNNITYTRKQRVLNQISFSLKKGEVLGIVGPNGAGKSTLLKLISNVLSLQQGNIDFHGNRVAHLIETPALYPFKSGKDHLEYIMGINGYHSLDKLQNLIEILEIQNIMKKKIKSYSLGMKQKIGILSAVVGNNNIIVLDEPNNSLDYKSVINMRELVAHLKSEDKSVIITSHQLKELEQLCDRILFLNNGEINHEYNTSESDSSLEKYILEKGN